MATHTSKKHIMIDDVNKRVIIATSVAAFVVIFCAVASQTLFSQMMYQNRIVSAKKDTLKQLKTNQAAVSNLNGAYSDFISTPQNVLGGNTQGTSSQDGDNAKIVLDALPSKYDFPALATSLEKLLSAQGIQIQSISGTDDEVAQASNSSSATPQPIPMPSQLTASGSYGPVNDLAKTFEASIRPIEIQTLTLSGDDSNLTISLSAQTYYQPEKLFTIGKKVVK
ncbi:hypothetical protein BH09PAT3_BH09PAT3_5230 [soil metagenome]